MDQKNRACVIILLCTFLARAQSPAESHFRQGVRWLHSFEYDDARAEFVQAQTLDPTYVMAFWGEALSHTEPLWQRQDLPAARGALNKLAASIDQRRAKAKTDRELDYLAAVEALYGAGDYRSRTFAYEDAMRQLVSRHPDDLDAAAFYALSILGTAHDGRNARTYMRAAAVAEDVYSRDPNHPGALHYLIHCYDDPVHAPLGLRAARRYAKIAPEAPHALHMPSHIFAAMGMWDDVIASNESSWNASESRVQTKKLRIEERGYHALYWLQYAYLQQGRYKEAHKLLEMMERDAKQSGSAYLREHLALMNAAYVLETGKWNAVDDLRLDDLDAVAAAAHVFTSGYAALQLGDTARARQSVKAFQTIQHRTNPHAEHASVSGSRPWEIMAKQLEGLVSGKSGLGLLEQAARMEDEMPYEFGPPVPVKPAHELLGETLLGLGRYREARAEFARALERAPGRAAALLGLARATEKAGDVAAAQTIFSELRHIRRKADVPPAKIN